MSTSVASLKARVGALEKGAAANAPPPPMSPELRAILNSPHEDRIGHYMRDPRGNPLRPSAIHRLMWDHQREAEARGMHCGQMMPFGIGKTEQLVVGGLLEAIGRDRNLRYGIVSAVDDVARDRAASVKAHIEGSDEYRELFPHVRPDFGDWQKERFTVARDFVSSNPTVRAMGMLSSRTGIRLDRLFVDDGDDDKSMSQAVREARNRAMFNVFMPRLDAGSLCVYVCNSWHDHDIAHELIDIDGWGWCVGGYSDEVDRFEIARFYNTSDTGRAGRDWANIRELAERKGVDVIELPLWEEKFDREELLKRKRLKPRVFARGYQSRAMSDSEKWFPHFRQCVVIDARPPEQVLAGLGEPVTGTGSDIAGKKRRGSWVIGGAITPSVKVIHEHWVRNGSWTMPQFLDAMGSVHRQLDCSYHCVETDGLQTSYQEGASVDPERWPFGSLIIPHKTGARKINEETGKSYTEKLDPDTGVRALDVQFMNRGWRFVYQSKHELECECPMCELCRQFESAPAGEDQDAIMGLWKLDRGASHALSDGSDVYGVYTLDEEEVAAAVKREMRDQRAAKVATKKRGKRLEPESDDSGKRGCGGERRSDGSLCGLLRHGPDDDRGGVPVRNQGSSHGPVQRAPKRAVRGRHEDHRLAAHHRATLVARRDQGNHRDLRRSASVQGGRWRGRTAGRDDQAAERRRIPLRDRPARRADDRPGSR